MGSDEDARIALVRALDRAPSSWHLSLHRDVPDDVDVIVCDTGVDAPGAIVVGDGDAGDVVDRIVQKAGPGGRIIVVSSPSGGTGVTSLALHLAAYLAEGSSTCLLDLDERWGCRARLGLDPSVRPDQAVPVAGGFRLLHGSDRLDDAVAAFDRVVVDAPKETLERLPAYTSEGLLVVSPTAEGIRRAHAFLGEDHPVSRWVIATNRLGPGGEITRAQIENALEQPVLELPCCATLRDAEDDGRLVAKGWSRWSRAVARIAREIAVAG